MNSNEDKELESAISRELKALPELAAPASVAPRVMAAVERSTHIPWYCRPWQTWSGTLQVTALVTMLILFGAICFAGWELSHVEAVTQAKHRVAQWLSGFNTIGNIFSVLVGSTILAVKKLGTTFIIACLVAAAFGYAVFLSLGTVYFRLAFPKR